MGDSVKKAIVGFFEKKAEARKQRDARQKVVIDCIHALSSTHEGRTKLAEVARHVEREAHA